MRFERLLAVGGIGEVYEATLDGQRVAVKTLLPTFRNVDEAVQRMVREAKAGGLLDHVNIVDVIAYGVLGDGAPYLAMELVDGTDVAKLLEQGPLPPDRAVAIAKQMLDGIAHAHSRGVLHRDLKPANLMLVGDVVKILDFGLAKLVGLASADEAKLTQTGAIFGTPTYMAPEQVLARPPTAATDQYAAALILFEMLAGRPPFVGADVQATLRLQAAAPAPPLRVHPVLDAIVARALQKAPEARFSSALEMRAALDAI